MTDAFADLDDDGFEALQTAPTVSPADSVRIGVSQMGRSTHRAVELMIGFNLHMMIGSPVRAGISFHRARWIFAIAGDANGHEFGGYPKTDARKLRLPAQDWTVPQTMSKRPAQHRVDLIGKRLLVLIPEELRVRAGLVVPRAAQAREPERFSLDELAPEEAPGLPRAFGGQRFAPSELNVIDLFLKRSNVSIAAVMAATHDPAKGDDERDEKIVDVFICKLRPKLKMLGLEIRGLPSTGWSLSIDHKSRLKSLIAEVQA